MQITQTKECGEQNKETMIRTNTRHTDRQQAAYMRPYVRQIEEGERPCKQTHEIRRGTDKINY